MVGPHRCGTSAIARSLRVFSAELGTSLMPADRYNERGYWEDTEIYEFNRSLMSHLGRDWDSLDLISEEEFATLLAGTWVGRACDLLHSKVDNCELFGVKDPRMSILLPFWLPVFRQCDVSPIFLIATRHPAAANFSLQVRNQTEEVRATWLWIIHSLAAFQHSVGYPRALIRYEDLVADPEAMLASAAKATGLVINHEELSDYKSNFLDSKLDHYTSSQAGIVSCPGPATPLALEIYETVSQGAGNASVSEKVSRSLSKWMRQIDDISPLLKALDASERERKTALEAASWALHLDDESGQTQTQRENVFTEPQFKPDVAALRKCDRDTDFAQNRAVQEAHIHHLRIQLKHAVRCNRQLKAAFAQKQIDQEIRIAGLAAENASQKNALDAVELWQRSWLRRAFRRWHRLEGPRRMGFLRRLERSVRRRRKAIFGISSRDELPRDIAPKPDAPAVGVPTTCGPATSLPDEQPIEGAALAESPAHPSSDLPTTETKNYLVWLDERWPNLRPIRFFRLFDVSSG